MAHPINPGGLRIKFSKSEEEEFNIRHPSERSPERLDFSIE